MTVGEPVVLAAGGAACRRSRPAACERGQVPRGPSACRRGTLPVGEPVVLAAGGAADFKSLNLIQI